MNNTAKVRQIITWERLAEQAIKRARQLRAEITADLVQAISNGGEQTTEYEALATVTLPLTTTGIITTNTTALTNWLIQHYPAAVEPIVQIRPDALKTLLKQIDIANGTPTLSGVPVPGLDVRRGGQPKALTIKPHPIGRLDAGIVASDILRTVGDTINDIAEDDQ
jgi:hypothetical protein